MKKKNLTEKLKAQNSSSAFSAPDIKNIMNTVKSRISEDSSHNERKVTFMHFKKRFVAVALCAVLVLGITAFAAEYGDNIIKRITTGYNSFVQVDPDAPCPIPDELLGEIFDKEGNMLESLTKDDVDNMYNENGERITQEMYAKMIEDITGGMVKVGYEYNAEESEITFKSLEEAQDNLVFDIKIPKYLPNGHELTRVYTYKGDDKNVSGEYITIVYNNAEGKEITIFERLLNENTAFEAGTDGTLEEIFINGRKAVIVNDTMLSFETEDNISVTISVKKGLTKDELIEIAESIN